MVTKLRQPRQTAWFSVGFPYRTILLVLCFSWVPTSPVFAQSQTPEESKSMGAEVQLRVSTSSSEFYLGDVIPLDLAFGSMVPKGYQINLARYDRSGRMGYEQFIAEPKDATRDPLYLYFNSIAGFVSGGLTKFEFLAPSPTVLHLKLNEWVSFDHLRRRIMRHPEIDPTTGRPSVSGLPISAQESWPPELRNLTQLQTKLSHRKLKEL